MKPTAILTGILIILIYDNVQCELVTKPTDKVVTVNDSVIMECSSNDVSDSCELEWKHYKVKSRTGNTINYKKRSTSDIKCCSTIANTTVGNCNLKINGTPSAAGTYECMDLSNGDSSRAELIIIDPDYRIKGTVSECFAHYYGNCDPPMLQWMALNGNGWNPIDAADKTSSRNFISINISTPTNPFRCKITVSKPPGLFYEWHSPTLEGGGMRFFIPKETAIKATPLIATTDESLSAEVKESSLWEIKALSNGCNESVSMAAIVALVIGVFIVSCELPK